ncbi:MAG: 3-dehydroquinate synthase [Thermosediminibacterales bacterium]|nr:3-dehydroquinate synthase [Thermosediminibacterales bacterium]
MERVEVKLGENSYTIFITNGEISKAGRFLRQYMRSPKVMIITDSTVNRLAGEEVKKSFLDEGLDVFVEEIPPGEKSKRLSVMESLFTAALEKRLDRDSVIVALGGGVVGDIAGFTAACYMRGIDYFQIPTTLLAQVDSSVGGKVAVNLPHAKNIIGAFHQPKSVFIDISVLKSLPEREFRAGLSEVIKYGIIWDWEFFEFLEKELDKIFFDFDEEKIIKAVKRSCEIKAHIVSKDEKEKGIRAILNFGHTIGHAVEAAGGYSRFRHGEAVAVGQYFEAKLAVFLGLVREDIVERIKAILIKAGLPIDFNGIDPEEVIRNIYYDKKIKREIPRFVLPKDYGMVDVFEIDHKTLEKFFDVVDRGKKI